MPVRGIEGLMPESSVTRRLRDEERNEQMRRAMMAMDEINKRLGRDTVRVEMLACAGAWQTRFRKRLQRALANSRVIWKKYYGDDRTG